MKIQNIYKSNNITKLSEIFNYYNYTFQNNITELDFKIIVAHELKIEPNELLLSSENITLSELNLKNIDNMIKERVIEKKPISHILGYKEFWSMKMYVNKFTLAPRPETEILVELSLKYIAKLLSENKKVQILDLGTGTGAIIISIIKELESKNLIKNLNNIEAYAVDNCDKALEIAKKNAIIHDINNINFIKSDWFQNLNKMEFDLIISNPPYISIEEWTNLMPEVKNHEPKIALTDFEDGLKHYKIILNEIKNFLKIDGICLLEIGYSQLEPIKQIIMNNPKLKFIDSYQDLSGLDRCICLNLNL